MSRDRRNQSDSLPVRVPAETGSSGVGKVTLTQSLAEPAPAPARGEPGAPVTTDATAVQRKVDPSRGEPAASAAAPRPSYDLSSLFGRAPREPAVPVQRQASSPSEPAAVSQIAAQGVAGAGGALPHLPQLQASFGHHDVSGVRAHQGPQAATAARELGADAYATGNAVAFGRSPDLHTAAHEAAHVVQQRGGVQLKGGIDRPGDAYERHADAVAEAVVAGRSAEALLDQQETGTGDSHAIQRKELPEDAKALESQASLKNTDVEIPALEGALLSTRLEAVKKGLLSKTSFDASLALSTAMTQLQPAVTAKGAVDIGVQVHAALAAQQLFTALQRETADDKNFQVMPTMGPGAESRITEQNRYTEELRVSTSFLLWSSTREYAGWLKQLPGLIHLGKWSEAFDGYRRLMTGLDLWVADQLRKTGSGTQDQALGNAHQYHSQLRTGLEQIADKHATRVPALFHPNAETVAKDKAADRPTIDSVPMNVYFWKDAADGKFHVYDLTTPSRPHEQTLDGQPTAAMMNTFFEEVARYPEGEVRYSLPDGARGVAPTTGKTKWYEWVGYAGLVVAAVGLAFVTVGASVPATVCFAAGALAGGISAGGHLADTVHLGTATTATVVLDVAQVAASFASFGAMSLTVKAGSAAAALAGSRYFVPLLGTAAAADTVQVVALTSVTFTELDKIQQGAGTPEDKQRAMTVLLTQLVVTGGLTVMSVQGARNARAMAGKPLEVVDQNGVNVLRLAGETAPDPAAVVKPAVADTHAPSGSAGAKPTDHGASGAAREAPKAESESTASTTTTTLRVDDKAASASPSRRQVLGTDPKRGYIDYEGTVGEEIEARFGRLDRDPSGAGEWIGKSGAYRGKVFDLLGVPPGKSQFHGPKMERFLPSIDAHFLKQIDYIVLDTRNMTAIQRQAVVDYINSKWSSQSARLIIL